MWVLVLADRAENRWAGEEKRWGEGICSLCRKMAGTWFKSDVMTEAGVRSSFRRSILINRAAQGASSVANPFSLSLWLPWWFPGKAVRPHTAPCRCVLDLKCFLTLSFLKMERDHLETWCLTCNTQLQPQARPACSRHQDLWTWLCCTGSLS